MADPAPLKTLVIGETPYETLLTRKFEHRTHYIPTDPRLVRCVIPGVVRKIYVHRGQRVSRGQTLLMLEAMKMENDVLSPMEGVVHEVQAVTGTLATKGALLVTLEPLPARVFEDPRRPL